MLWTEIISSANLLLPEPWWCLRRMGRSTMLPWALLVLTRWLLPSSLAPLHSSSLILLVTISTTANTFFCSTPLSSSNILQAPGLQSSILENVSRVWKIQFDQEIIVAPDVCLNMAENNQITRKIYGPAFSEPDPLLVVGPLVEEFFSRLPLQA